MAVGVEERLAGLIPGTGGVLVRRRLRFFIRCVARLPPQRGGRHVPPVAPRASRAVPQDRRSFVIFTPSMWTT